MYHPKGVYLSGRDTLWNVIHECYTYGTSTLQMSTKQARIEKMKLEIRKLEAERDGLKQVTKPR